MRMLSGHRPWPLPLIRASWDEVTLMFRVFVLNSLMGYNVRPSCLSAFCTSQSYCLLYVQSVAHYWCCFGSFSHNRHTKVLSYRKCTNVTQKFKRSTKVQVSHKVQHRSVTQKFKRSTKVQLPHKSATQKCHTKFKRSTKVQLPQKYFRNT